MYMGTAAISDFDYIHMAVSHADLLVVVGHDPVEKVSLIMICATAWSLVAHILLIVL